MRWIQTRTNTLFINRLQIQHIHFPIYILPLPLHRANKEIVSRCKILLCYMKLYPDCSTHDGSCKSIVGNDGTIKEWLEALPKVTRTSKANLKTKDYA